MDAVNVQTMVNLTGGSGDELATTITSFDRAFPRRFVSMTEPTWSRASEAGYAAWQADEIARAKAAGAVGVKILKTLGLYLRAGGAATAAKPGILARLRTICLSRMRIHTARSREEFTLAALPTCAISRSLAQPTCEW